MRRMQVSRRRALLVSLGAALVPLAAMLPAMADAGGPDPATLDAFLDVLLPADDLSPAASALGIGAEITDFATESPLFERLLAAGCQWLDALDARRFAELPDETQTAVVTFMSTSDFNEVPRRFYHLTRLLAVEFYYARAEAIAGFPLAVAPQPAGYPPPWG